MMRIFYSTSRNSTEREIFPEWCESQGIRVIEIFSREELRNLDFYETDLLISDRTSFLFEKEWLLANRFLKLNVHPSLLPLHRGSFPIFWSALLGSKWGVTVHEIEAGIDDGPIVDQIEISYEDSCTFRDLYIRYREVTQILLEEIVAKLMDGQHLTFTPQPTNSPKAHTLNKSNKLFQKLSSGWDTRIIDARDELEEEIYNYWQDYKQK